MRTKEELFKYIGAEDSIYGYSRSYKLVLYKILFADMWEGKKSYVYDVASNFKDFYVNRINEGKIPDKDVDERIEKANLSSVSDILEIIKINPYKHTYHGAHGTEVSMLIRRLKERIFGKSDDCMQCIATSATLGGGKDDIVNVVTFANQLFSEKFYAEDIILSERDALASGENNECPLSLYQELLECYVNNDVKALRGKINAKGIDLDEIIYNFLINDKFTYELRKVITSEVLTIDELAKKLLPNDNVDQVKVAIVSLVELGSKIKDIKTGLPLINAKYHVFVRSLEGGFVSLYPQKKVFTERHNEYNGAPVYELMNCIRCGQEYIVGSIDQTKRFEISLERLTPCALWLQVYLHFISTLSITYSIKKWNRRRFNTRLILNESENWYVYIR